MPFTGTRAWLAPWVWLNRWWQAWSTAPLPPLLAFSDSS